jgi:hypothetical protein
VQHCIQVDDLLRRTCARIGRHLSAKNAQKCDLPAVTFEARTAGPYRAFKASFRAEIKANEAKIEAVLRKTRAAFERQFAQVRAGRVSMLDLESLAGELGDRCTVIEREWLAPGPKPK